MTNEKMVDIDRDCQYNEGTDLDNCRVGSAITTVQASPIPPSNIT